METHTTEAPGGRASRVKDRFGLIAEAGYQPVMHSLLLDQKALGLSSPQLNVLLHISMHWYEPHSFPFPSARTIANRMGLNIRTVQEHIKALEEKGFFRVVKGDRRGDLDRYDLTPMLQKLEPYALRRIRLTKERVFD